MRATKPLAYYGKELFTAVKSFTVLACEQLKRKKAFQERTSLVVFTVEA
jgi:hypothetical protein